MKNTHLHEPCSMNHPPSTGPIAAVIDVNPDHVPIARPRSLLRKIGADQGQAAGDKQRPADSLEAPRDNQAARCRAPVRTRPRLSRRSRRRRRNLAAAVQIAQRSADQQQRRQEKRIRFHHPLNLRQRRMQGRLQRRQRHVHHRSVNECHARTENGRGQNPPPFVDRPAASHGPARIAASSQGRSGDAGHTPFSWKTEARPNMSENILQARRCHSNPSRPNAACPE